jgi:hypothetical protein
MKKIIFFLFITTSYSCKGQRKIVRIESDSIFISFFFKSNKAIKHTKNDTTFFLSKAINDSCFNLRRYQNGKLISSLKYKAVPVVDSLVVNNKVIGKNGISKIIKSKEKYYLGLLFQ